MAKRIDITPDMELALALIDRADRVYRPGVDSYSFLELPRLALADATLAAVRAADARSHKRRTTLARLPKPTPAVVEMAMRPKRRRA